MVRRNNMKKYGFNASRIATILLAFLLVAGLGIPVSHPGLMSAYADPAVSSWAKLANAIRSGGTQTITLGADFAYDGTSIEIPAGAKITITGTNQMIYSTADPADGKYNPMFVVKDGASLTIEKGVTLSGKVGDNGSQCPDGTSGTPTYTADKFTGAYADGAKTYTPKGFFIDVAAGGSATLNGTLSDFITSRDKSSTPRYVAPVVANGVVANGTGATFNLGADGVIKNNLVGYIVDDDMAYTDAQTIKQYVKGAPPNSLRVPGSAEQKSHPDKYERTRNRNAGIDGNADEDLGSGITGTAGAVIYKDGAQGEILGKIDNNRGDTGGVMASGDGTVVHIKGANISRNVGVQFGGGSTTEQGAMIAMHSGTMKQNVAWFGGGAVYATENGVDWLLGKIVKADGKPDFDARKDGKFTMKNGSLEENTAFTRGGAILVDSDGVTVKSGKLKNNMSWMLGGAVYVMGDHPKYTYTMRIDPVYVHDNTAVSGLQEARAQAALEGEKTSADLEADNAKLQRKLAAPSDCADISETDDLFTADPISDHNTDDRTDGKGNDGTGGGVWLCPYGSVFFDAAMTGNVVIHSNYATGTTSNSANNADATYNSNKSRSSRSKISGGSDLHTDQGKQDGGVTISGLESEDWINENNDQPYLTETSSNRTNLVNTREPQAGDVPNKYGDDDYVEVTGNIARRGGGLASDGKFYFGPAPSLAGINAKMTVGKEWTAAAKTEPIAIRVSVKNDSVEHVVADVPLDGVANGPVSEFDTVSELKPVGNLWTGEFSLPLVVTDDNGNNPIQLYELYYGNELIDITKMSERERLGELVKTNKQGDIEIRQATDVEIIYKEMNVKRDDGGNWVVDGEHGTHVFTPDSVDFSKLKFTVEEKEEVTEKYINDDGDLAEETVYGIYTLGLALKMESGNDNEPIVEKYVNKKVHADIVNFDQDFTYDVMAYVPYKATEITIEDTLVKGLEFADKNGNKVKDSSTVESITVKPMNDHKPNGTVSEDAMKNPSNPNSPYELKDSSNHTEISIEDNKISVTIRNIQQEKDSSSYESHPSELKGRWVRLTFHARIKDEYRSIEALKALQDSWLDKDDSKRGSGPHDVSFENPDKVLIKPVLEAKKDTIVWAVEGPQRLFARTVSGAYFATEDKENGTGWVKLDQGSDLWNNADRRYRGQARDTKRELDIENADSALVAALEDMDEVKRYRAVRGAEGGTKLFVEIESISSGDKEVYQTPNSDKKQGHTWDKLEPGTGDYNNAINVMNGANNTVRKFDFESEAVSLKGDGLNWPVITEEKHEGMSNQAGYQVKFGNNASAKLRSNIVTVVPETTELDVVKKWAPNGKWPDDVKNVKFNVFSKKGNVVKQVYVDDDGNVVGAFEEGDQIPAGAKELTVTLSEDDPATEDKDESKTTVKGLPKLIGTTYIAWETKITYIEGGEEKAAAVDYLDDTYKEGTAKLGEGAAAETVFVSVDSSYKGNGAKLKKLKLTNAIPVRGAIAQNRLWALASNGDYYFTAENDTDGTADSSQWTKIEKPAGNADPNSGGVKNYAFAQKILGKIDANGRFSTVEDEDLDNDKIEELDQPTVFDVTNEITATNEKAAIEKYVNNDVHADLKEFNKAFKYDIMVYVPAGSTKLTITDPLARALEFAKKKDSLDAAEKTAAEKATDAGETIESVVYKAKNDHKAGSTVAGKDENNPATAIAAMDYKASIADNTLLIEFEGAEDPDNVGKKLPVAFAGNWVQVTFWAKYTDEIIRAADAGDFKKIRENGAVISEKYPNVAQDAAEDEFSHEGTVNKASANISVGNDFNFNLASNEVTVKPETEKLWVQKKWLDEEGEELSKWPKGMTVKINVYKNAKGSEAEVLETLEVSSFEPVSSKTYPKLVGVTYSVDEVEVPEKYAKLDEIIGDGSEEKPFVITNAARKYTAAEITKKWVGATMDEIPSAEDFKSYLVLKNSEGMDVSEEFADNLTVTARGSTYTAKWKRLPDGKYTVEEKEIPGFETKVDGNIITNKKKPSEEKPEIEKYVNQAVHKDIELDEVFTYDIIAYVTKDADSVTITDKLHDMLTFDGDSSDVSVADLGEADNHLVTNNINGVRVNEKASVAQKGKPVDGAEVEINGQTLKVFITNKLKKTTAKGEDVYTPVEIESVNPKEKGYYELIEDEYVLTEDTAPAADKTYYVMEEPEEADAVPSYNPVAIETVNPSELGYYENDGYEYVLTKDVTPDADTTYYVKKEGQTEEADGYEYDGENQPVTALRGHWIKVTFNAKINGKTLEEVKKAYRDISASDVDDSRDPENTGNAPVVSVENHTGLQNDASYTIGVANEAGMKEDVHRDKSNIVTVKPKDEGDITPKPDDGDDVAPADEDAGTAKSADTGDETPLGFAIFGLLGSAAVFELMRRRRMS